MGQDGEVKIRTVPRSNEKSSSKTERESAKKKAAQVPRWIVYVGTTSSLLLASVLLYPGGDQLHKMKPAVVKTASASQDLSSVGTRLNDVVARHWQEAAVKREMLEQARRMENMQAQRVDTHAANYMGAEDESRNLGVHLDQEDTAGQVYRDINGTGPSYADTLPHDKINNRLANRKWLNEMERTERINFVRNFLKSAYDRGYEVQLDHNLVVVGVRRITNQKVNIDQIIDRMAKQGL